MQNLTFMTLLFIITGIIIFFHSNLLGKIKILFSKTIKNKLVFDRVVGRIYFIIGIFLLLISLLDTNNKAGIVNVSKANIINVIVFLILTIILTLLHSIIAKITFNNQQIEPLAKEDFFLMTLDKKIQIYMEIKRRKSRAFHTFYQIALGFIIIFGSCIIFFARWVDDSVSWIAFVIAVITTLIALKALFINELNKADNWLPILYDIDKGLADKELTHDEINKTYYFEKYLDKRAPYNIGLGVIIAFCFIAVLLIIFPLTGK